MRRFIAGAILGLAVAVLSEAGSGQTPVLHAANSKSPVETSPNPQTFWVRLSHWGPSSRGTYDELKAALVIALHDSDWKWGRINGIGGELSFNPALIVFADFNVNTKLVRRGQVFTDDEWIVWTKLPPLPKEVIGTPLTFQLLLWENKGAPKYTLTFLPYGSPNLTIVPE